jgi:signal transduction histidine kinase
MPSAHEELTTRPADQARREVPAMFVFGSTTRLGVSAAIVVVAALAIGLSSLAADDRTGYVLAHSLSAAPFMLGALGCSGVVRRSSPPQYRVFWQRWFDANLLGGMATLAAIGAVVLASPLLLVVDMVLLVAAVPFWVSATLLMLRAQAGRRDASVDIVDATMALVVLGAPGVLLLAEPMLETTDVVFAGPFALFLLLTPAGLYGACLNVARVPRGERVTQGLGLALAGAFVISVALQLAHVLSDLQLPLPVFVGFHVANLSLVMALPLWAHRVTAGGLGRLPVDRQMRRSNPMPAVSAVVLPVLAAYVFAARGDDPWAGGYLAIVLLAVIVLNALRHTMLSREAQRLSAELARMAEERRQLLASMVRALEDDRRRTVTELHTQAVGSLSTLGTVVQTACVSLPPATATVVRETIRQLQGDLSDRAEELRMLMMAMRPPSFDAGGGSPAGDDALSAALRAYASELHDSAAGAMRPAVHVVVDPRMELDRSTMTIVYRIAQEALLNAVRHARATLVVVTVGVEDGTGRLVVEVTDDGIGFDRHEVDEGSGLSSMQLFTDLGRGDLTLRSAPGEGTVVRSVLGARCDTPTSPGGGRSTGTTENEVAIPDDGGGTARHDRRHLRLIPPVDAAPQSS